MTSPDEDDGYSVMSEGAMEFVQAKLKARAAGQKAPVLPDLDDGIAWDEKFDEIEAVLKQEGASQSGEYSPEEINRAYAVVRARREALAVRADAADSNERFESDRLNSEANDNVFDYEDFKQQESLAKEAKKIKDIVKMNKTLTAHSGDSDDEAEYVPNPQREGEPSEADAFSLDRVNAKRRTRAAAVAKPDPENDPGPDWLENAAMEVGLPDGYKSKSKWKDVKKFFKTVKVPPEEAAFVLYAQLRGLVGQRGPLDAEDPNVVHDAQLAYALPPSKAMAKAMPRVRAIAALPETDAEARLVEEALARVADDFDVATDGVAALAALEGNYAITGAMPASEDDARGGIERPHAVRWLPRGEQGARLAVVATLEHAAARCAQCAEDESLLPAERAALRATAAALKVRQLPHLYAALDAADRDPAGAKATRHVHDPENPLVTTPCAVVRGTLSYPIDGAGQQIVARPLSTLTPPEDADAIAKKAMGGAKFATAQLRNDLKSATGAIPTVYAAPALEHAVVPSTIVRASPATGAAFDEYGEFENDSVCDSLQASDYSLAMWRRILRRALVSVHAAVEGDSEHVDNLLKELQAEGGSHVEAQERRDGLWTQFHRHVAISHDRLWVFVRTLSGCLGGDINEIISMADEQTAKSTKALQDQRLAVAKRTADAQSKIVETIVSGMIKESKLTFDKEGDDLVVVNNETRKELRSLASGESGRPFFEANVAMRNLSENGDANMKLSTLLKNVATVGEQIQRSLEKSLLSGAGAGGTASVVELSHPSNCYFVSIKADAVAAIRSTHERLNVELGRRGRRRLHLWELIEGGCMPLSTRFAEAVGHVLVQARSSTGVSAMYVSQSAIQTNAIQGRIALERLATMAVLYAAHVGTPNFEGGEDSRKQTINAGAYVEDVNVGRAMRAAAYVPERNLLDAAIHPSGWSAVGFRRG